MFLISANKRFHSSKMIFPIIESAYDPGCRPFKIQRNTMHMERIHVA